MHMNFGKFNVYRRQIRKSMYNFNEVTAIHEILFENHYRSLLCYSYRFSINQAKQLFF